MKRDISEITNKEFDLLIVGGGIFGAFTAWDAALRGLSVALIEKGDFSHATSANHFKVVHGGIRYLQHGDLLRVWESSRERSNFLRIAPHLAEPLPILIPTYGRGKKGKLLLSLGMWVYDMLTFNRNRGIQKERQIPKGQLFSRKDVIQYFPGMEKKEGLTGGAVFYDGQFYHSPRLVISAIKSAVQQGAQAANYIEVINFLRKNNTVFGAEAIDLLNGEKIEIRAKMVLNATGPWAHRLLESTVGIKLSPPPSFSRDLAFIVKRKIDHRYGIALLTKSQDKNALIHRGSRHLLVLPWKEYTLFGVWHKLFTEPPENISVSNEELNEYVQEINEAYPDLQLHRDEITKVNTGLTLFGTNNCQGNEKFSYGHRSILIDHSNKHQLKGLLTLIGVRATTARGMAKNATDIVMQKLGRVRAKCQTDQLPLYGGDISSFSEFLETAIKNRPLEVSESTIRDLAHHHGTHYPKILALKQWLETIPFSNVLKAEVIYGVREEMAQKLSDIVYRRTSLGTAECPEEEVLKICAQIMAEELGWDQEKISREVQETRNLLPQFS